MEDKEDIFLELKAPKLDSVEKLYIRAYLSKLSHSYAHSVVSPGIKHPKENNPYSRRVNVQFHIAKMLQEKAEALSITPEVILEKLFKEATREDRTSSHSARINALNILGKHLGLFQEKKEVEKFTFNIVNYSKKFNETEKEAMETTDPVDTINSSIILTSYSTKQEEFNDNEEDLDGE
jgi:hypothetical protein